MPTSTPTQAGQDPTTLLGTVPLFSGLEQEERSGLAKLFIERKFSKNGVIVFAGDPGDALFVVASGQVKVVRVSEDGREVILSVLGPGSFFGEMSLVDDKPRSAHVIAMEDSRMLVLLRREFEAHVRLHPDVAIGLLRELSRRLRRADQSIANLVLLDVNGRVADLLLRLAGEEDGSRITRRLTHQTIAQMIGTSRETVSRTMRQLVTGNVITTSRREIVLLNPAALQEAAGRS